MSCIVDSVFFELETFTVFIRSMGDSQYYEYAISMTESILTILFKSDSCMMLKYQSALVKGLSSVPSTLPIFLAMVQIVNNDYISTVINTINVLMICLSFISYAAIN